MMRLFLSLFCNRTPRSNIKGYRLWKHAQIKEWNDYSSQVGSSSDSNYMMALYKAPKAVLTTWRLSDGSPLPLGQEIGLSIQLPFGVRPDLFNPRFPCFPQSSPQSSSSGGSIVQ
ncbi:hypothetical protein Tco_1004285 [Tanacetum coccineum]|uniref:Uncharacterized protein n=1 Tax=Tanacetum coccineum TaxID=301880 RepID=A0ABQ5FBY2_9ASTR